MSKLSLVIVGHVDHGKSSLIGRLLYDTGSISMDKLDELKKASLKTEHDMEFAFLLDHLREEREQGITIDTTRTFFKTEKREYVIIDAPGHVEFVRNMITGASQADVGLLIVDALEGTREQTKRHLYILHMIGISQVVVVINKMDLVGYEQTRYEEVKNEVQHMMDQLNLDTDIFIPVSAIKGDNVCKVSENMNWYRGSTVLEALEEFQIRVDQEDNCGIFTVQDIYKTMDRRINVGRLERGKLSVGDYVNILPTKQQTRVKSIEKFQEVVRTCDEGECVGIVTEHPVFIERGTVICTENSLLRVSDTLEARIFLLDSTPIKKNDRLILRCSTQESIVEIKEIKEVYNTETYSEIYKNAEKINYLDAAAVILELKKEMVVSGFHTLKSMGRFVLVRNNSICAGGIIINTNLKNQE